MRVYDEKHTSMAPLRHATWLRILNKLRKDLPETFRLYREAAVEYKYTVHLPKIGVVVLHTDIQEALLEMSQECQ